MKNSLDVVSDLEQKTKSALIALILFYLICFTRVSDRIIMGRLILNIKNMNPIKDLINEHDSIKSMLRVMENMSDRMAGGEEVPVEDMRSGVAYMKEFGDKCHHSKEENYLFPMMKEREDAHLASLSDELADEHDQARGHVKSMEGIMQKGEEMRGLAEALRPHVKELKDMMEKHIGKEEDVLFPAAEQSLSQDKMKELEAGFIHIENDVIGEARHEELQDMADELSEKYLRQE